MIWAVGKHVQSSSSSASASQQPRGVTIKVDLTQQQPRADDALAHTQSQQQSQQQRPPSEYVSPLQLFSKPRGQQKSTLDSMFAGRTTSKYFSRQPSRGVVMVPFEASPPLKQEGKAAAKAGKGGKSPRLPDSAKPQKEKDKEQTGKDRDREKEGKEGKEGKRRSPVLRIDGQEMDWSELEKEEEQSEREGPKRRKVKTHWCSVPG